MDIDKIFVPAAMSDSGANSLCVFCVKRSS